MSFDCHRNGLSFGFHFHPEFRHYVLESGEFASFQGFVAVYDYGTRCQFGCHRYHQAGEQSGLAHIKAGEMVQTGFGGPYAGDFEIRIVSRLFPDHACTQRLSHGNGRFRILTRGVTAEQRLAFCKGCCNHCALDITFG